MEVYFVSTQPRFQLTQKEILRFVSTLVDEKKVASTQLRFQLTQFLLEHPK